MDAKPGAPVKASLAATPELPNTAIALFIAGFLLIALFSRYRHYSIAAPKQ
jgi:hypothetical protein